MNRLAPALLTLAALALLATGCGDDAQDDLGQAPGVFSKDVKTLDAVEKALVDAGVCIDPHDVEQGAVPASNKAANEVVKARQCDKPFLQMTEMASVPDRDAAAEDINGDDFYYKGTGETPGSSTSPTRRCSTAPGRLSVKTSPFSSATEGSQDEAVSAPGPGL